MKTRKDVAKTFLRMVATGKVRAAYENFVGPGFRHHNAYYPGDAASLQAGMELVAVHSRVKHKPSDIGFAVVHVFRFKGSKIVEFWDIGMEVPADSPNEHGAF